MSLASPYQEHYYVADGVTTSFSFGEYFTGLSQAYVKCIIYFDDGTNCVPTFTVDMTTGFITIVTLTKPDGTVLTVPPAGSIVRVFRDTPEQQNVTASQLQNYTAKQLERIFDSVVAMIQEVSYSDLHKTIRLTETQRDVSVEQLTEEKDQGMLYWDFESRTIKATDYGQDEVVKSETVDRLLYLQPEGKIYFIPKGSTTPISIGSVSLHNDLGGRNAPDCHPESAITGLREHLQELRDKDIEIEEDVQIALNRSQEAKDTADEAKEIAEYAQTIAEEAKDIAEDAKETAEGIDEKAQTALDNSEEALDKVTQEITDRQDADDALQDQITDNKGAIEDHIANTNNPHQVTKAQVGLSNVDNTSDLNKPISTATQTALDLKADKSTTYTKTETDTLLSAKQDTISDLSTIRSNAQAGKAASDTIATYGDIVTHDVAEFATAAQGAKADTAVQPGDLATVATTGSYNDLSNKPTIPAAQVNSDWNAVSGVAQILNKPTLATVATSGSYNDLSNKPTIPTVNNATLTIQKNGTTVQTFTANQSTNATANISVPTKTSDITNDSGFITSSALAPYALSADLATVATTGDYDDLSNKPTIPTVGNGTITITQGGVSKGTFTTNQSGNTTIALDAGGGGSVAIDNTTITKNVSDEIQAVAVIDQNTGIAKTWTGTMAEYDAIVTKDPETEYIITDDIGGSATEIGQITEALNNKVDKGFDIVEFQEPTADNNYTWYKKYRNGWVEQGQKKIQIAHNSKGLITLPVVMANTDYIAQAGSNQVNSSGTFGANSTVSANAGTTTQVRLGQFNSASVSMDVWWEVKGMAA